LPLDEQAVLSASRGPRKSNTSATTSALTEIGAPMIGSAP